MVVAVKLRQLDAVAVVLSVGASTGQMCVQLGREHLDTFRRQTLYTSQQSMVTIDLYVVGQHDLLCAVRKLVKLTPTLSFV